MNHRHQSVFRICAGRIGRGRASSATGRGVAGRGPAQAERRAAFLCGKLRAHPAPVSLPASRTVATVSGSAGFALLEALIAIMIFSLGVMALVGLQAAMSKNVTSAQLRGEASVLGTQLIGAMWVDQGNLASYVMKANVCANPAYATCAHWGQRVSTQLPQGSGTVAVNGNLVDITLTWTLPGEAPARYVLQSSVMK